MLKELCTIRNLTTVSLIALSVACTLTGSWGAGVALNCFAINLMLFSSK